MSIQNVIDNIKDVVPIGVEVETSKKTHKMSKRSYEKKSMFWSEKKSTTTNKSSISSIKKKSTKKRPEMLKKNKFDDRGKKDAVKKNVIVKKKNIVLKMKKVVDQEIVEEDVTNILNEMMAPATKRSKRVVGGKKLSLNALSLPLDIVSSVLRRVF